MAVFHAGPPEQAEQDLARVKQDGTPVFDAIGPLPYAQMNTMLDEGYPRGALNYWKSRFLPDLSDDAILYDGRLLHGLPCADEQVVA